MSLHSVPITRVQTWFLLSHFIQGEKLSFSYNHGHDHSLASNPSVNFHWSTTVVLNCGCTLEHLGNLKSGCPAPTPGQLSQNPWDLVFFEVLQVVPMHIPVGESHFSLLSVVYKCLGALAPAYLLKTHPISFSPELSILASFCSSAVFQWLHHFQAFSFAVPPARMLLLAALHVIDSLAPFRSQPKYFLF